jgi:hypothetical protein
MIVVCEKCHKRYDDAERSTICPHELLWDPETLARKDVSISLLGKHVSFAHQPHGEVHQVTAVNFEGMVGLHDLPGWFDPIVFVVRS